MKQQTMFFLLYSIFYYKLSPHTQTNTNTDIMNVSLFWFNLFSFPNLTNYYVERAMFQSKGHRHQRIKYKISFFTDFSYSFMCWQIDFKLYLDFYTNFGRKTIFFRICLVINKSKKFFLILFSLFCHCFQQFFSPKYRNM